ncbi:MAG: hypothetical protein WCI20_11100 [bacterium]
MQAIQIPDDLADEARAIPGLPERLTRFIRLEVRRHQLREQRFGQETLEMVALAKSRASAQTSTGFDRTAVSDELMRLWEEFPTDARD